MSHALVSRIPYPRVRRALLADKHEPGLARFLAWLSRPPGCVLRYLSQRLHRGTIPKTEQGFLKGDWILLADTGRDVGYGSALAELQESGVRLASIVYDLIPMTHPQFFAEKDRLEFIEWMAWAAGICDLFLSISQTVQEQLKNFLMTQLPPEEITAKHFACFRLGMDLDAVRRSGPIRDSLRRLLSDNNCFLSVGTIEPRKNHLGLLAAFDLALHQGFQGALIIVGRVGWLCEPIIEKIITHPEFGKRLLHFQDITDTELAFCYQESRALIFSSKAEGFGLPIIEALARGLPVLASNIAVFREVGGDRLSYFDPDDPGDLARLLLKFEGGLSFSNAQAPSEFLWLNWRRSTEELLGKILQCQTPRLLNLE